MEDLGDLAVEARCGRSSTLSSAAFSMQTAWRPSSDPKDMNEPVRRPRES